MKTGNRIGDNAEMCILELVDYNEAMLGAEKLPKPKQPEEEDHQRKR
ncbi:MAG: bL17 family ribosomal protein [Marinilabiliales bacterium]|nr:bL17 family ribosomal protein [Marinilabiliales bacterium]